MPIQPNPFLELLSAARLVVAEVSAYECSDPYGETSAAVKRLEEALAAYDDVEV